MKMVFTVAAMIVAVSTLPVRAAEAVPCEQRLEELNAAITAAKPTADQTAKIADLKKKAIEECKHEKDAEADATIDAAMKVLGK